ncbi:MarR family winged helix-turn-helix transcriptional regulator [Methanobrevibacter sp. TMH8]|uniref:MarR family winged helix-turn-helix transcriptional regulator n=1 Tax=Methanobrevibacter sp. TMH8 TaxID=2848611 RepID=UPI001CCF25D3|nr:MarR family winged helix-turn-helix transcriptional regulator [Methanobrevibacter sp. TMH8]MBZ9571084.1 MarR family winged helix-turn-helix transcriptional regulator [Methanobrevibacter sp. TMH8]
MKRDTKKNLDTCNCKDDCNCTANGSICYCLDIRKASQNITKMYSEALKPTSLTPTQFGLLKHVESMGPVNVTNLAKQMGLDRTTLVRSLKILENKGFIEDISQNTQRNRRLILTKSGDEVLKKAIILWNSVQKKLEKHLGKNDLQKMLELISKLENI